MELVGRQHEAQQLPAEPADRQSQSIDKALVVSLVAEDPLARIAFAHQHDGWRQGTRRRTACSLI